MRAELNATIITNMRDISKGNIIDIYYIFIMSDYFICMGFWGFVEKKKFTNIGRFDYVFRKFHILNDYY